MRAESYYSSDDDKTEAYETISGMINNWMQEAINASQDGHPYALSNQIRISRIIDCLIIGLCGVVHEATLHAMIVTWT